MQWWQRQRYFMDFTLASLLRRKAKNGALVAVYSLIVFMITSVVFFAGAIRREADTVLAGAPEMLIQRITGGRTDLIARDYAAAIQSIRGVSKVQARLWGYYYHPAAKANFTVMVPPAFDGTDQQAMVGNGVLRTWPVAAGQTLYFKAYDGQVVQLAVKGAFAGDTELVSADLILVSEPTFQRLFGLPAQMATDLAVSIRNPKEARNIAEKIVKTLPDTRPILREEIRRTYASLFDWRSGYVLVLLSGSVLAFLIFAADKATGLNAEEKGEIAILKALGWDTADVLVLKFWEGQIISFSAFILGTLAAYLHVFWGQAPLFEHALKGWSVLYPQFDLAPTVDPYELAAIFALTVLPYTLVTIVPAWRAAIADPDAAMRKV